MINISYKILIAAVLILGLVVASPAFGKTVVIEADGTTYKLTTIITSYLESPDLLEAQPWWGDPGLAEDISEVLQYQLGDLEGGDQQSGGIPSALMAYGLDDGFVSITYWDGSLQNCPNDCPGQEGIYAYVIRDLDQGVPVNPLWSLILLAALLAWVARRRLNATITG